MSPIYTLSEAWSGVNWADLMAAQSAFGTDFYDRSIRTIVGTILWTEYRLVIKIGPKGALGSHEIRPIHSAPSLGQSISTRYLFWNVRFAVAPGVSGVWEAEFLELPAVCPKWGPRQGPQ